VTSQLATPVTSQLATPVTSQLATPVTSQLATPVTSQLATPVTSQLATPGVLEEFGSHLSVKTDDYDVLMRASINPLIQSIPGKLNQSSAQMTQKDLDMVLPETPLTIPSDNTLDPVQEQLLKTAKSAFANNSIEQRQVIATQEGSDMRPSLENSKTSAVSTQNRAKMYEDDISLKPTDLTKGLDQRSTKATEGSIRLEMTQTQLILAAQTNDSPQLSSQMQLNPILAANAGRSNIINAFPGKANWNDAISQKVLWMVGTQDQTASLTLNPPDMGPLQVIINVSNNMVDATFISDNLEVRQALENGMLALRDNMNQSGIVLDQVNIGTSNNPAQSFRQDQQAQSNSSARSNQMGREEGDVPQKIVSSRERVSNGLVDIFV
jgi:flagellar hook-length control protein FliK